MSRTAFLQSRLSQARELIAAGAVPESLKTTLAADLEEAVRRGFQIDFEQLRLVLGRYSGS